MRSEDIHVGDVLRVREWDDLLSHCTSNLPSGLQGFGFFFNTRMKYMCGRVFTVSDIQQNDRDEERYTIRSVEGIESEQGCWFLSAGMLEPYYDDTPWRCSAYSR